LILRKITKYDTTTCQVLRLKCTSFDFRWGYITDPAAGAYSATQDNLGEFKGVYFYVEGEEGRKGKSRGRAGKGPAPNISA